VRLISAMASSERLYWVISLLCIRVDKLLIRESNAIFSKVHLVIYDFYIIIAVYNYKCKYSGNEVVIASIFIIFGKMYLNNGW